MGEQNNLLDQKFDKLLVINEILNYKGAIMAWNCRCDCGENIQIRSSLLLNGSITSCGCEYGGKKPNLTGCQFGKLTIISRAVGMYGNDRHVWICQCSCGKIVEMATKRLLIQGQSSCGSKQCLNNKKPHIDLVGKKFGRLTVVESALQEFRKRNFTWKCQCDCGKITYVNTSRLNSNRTKSCGCGELENKLNICNKRREDSTKNRIIPRIQMAREIHKRHYDDGNLLFEEFLELSQRPCFYCGILLSNKIMFTNKHTQEYKDASLFTYNGLDILNYSNDKSEYVHNKDNVVTCCKVCNFSKRDKNYNEFLEWIDKVRKNLHKKGIIK